MTTLNRLVTIFSLPLILAGCAVGPEYLRPPLSIPAAWQASAGGTTGTAGEWPAPAWWKSFADPELDRLEETVRQGNPDLQAALSRIKQARAAAGIAGADRFPSLQAGAGAARGTSGGGAGSASDWEMQLSGRYELDLWGKYQRAREAAGADLQGSVFGREALALDLSGEVATTWFRLLAVHDRLAIATETLELERQNLDILEKRHRAGRISGLDLAQAKANRAQVEANLFTLEEERQKTANALAILLGKAPGALDTLPASLMLVVLPPAIPAGLPSALLERRPDLRAAEAGLVAANAEVGAAKANLLPSISLTAAGGYASQSLTTLLRPDSAFHSLGAGLLAPLFEGGRLRSEYALSQARFEELGHNYHRAVLAAFGEVENALVAIKQQAGRETFLEEAAGQAERSYRLALIRYEAGKIDYLPVLEADRSWLGARNALVEARLARLAATVALQVALGGGWENSPPSP